MLPSCGHAFHAAHRANRGGGDADPSRGHTAGGLRGYCKSPSRCGGWRAGICKLVPHLSMSFRLDLVVLITVFIVY
jgi:hypothetical protein